MEEAIKETNFAELESLIQDMNLGEDIDISGPEIQ